MPTCLTGKTEAKASAKDSASAKQKVTVVEPSKAAKADDGDESSDDEFADEDDSEMGEVRLSSNICSMLCIIVITYVIIEGSFGTMINNTRNVGISNAWIGFYRVFGSLFPT